MSFLAGQQLRLCDLDGEFQLLERKACAQLKCGHDYIPRTQNEHFIISSGTYRNTTAEGASRRICRQNLMQGRYSRVLRP